MVFSTSQTHHLTELACKAADAAAVETLALFRSRSLGTENKDSSAFDPVTRADRAAEAAIRNVICAARPNDAILGEEEDYVRGTSGVQWVLDPIDGTRGYISGTPVWGTLIAVGAEHGPEIGLVDQPYIGERFIGTPKGAILRRNGQDIPISVRDIKDLSEATICTTFPEVGTQQERHGFEAVARNCKLTRYGMDCYAYALLAAGHIDLVIEAGLAAYDIQAPMALVKAAGGVVSSWTGGDASKGGQVICAATPELHQAALALLAPFTNG